MDPRAAPKLILASASPRRQAILKSIGVPFEVHLPTCVETHYTDPILTVGKNASRKARSVQLRYPRATIIAADTVVSFKGKVLGKPKNYEEAYSWLLSYSGKQQHVYTAVAFACPGQANPEIRIEASSLQFKNYGAATVEEYLDRVKPFDRAGAYDINELGDLLIADRVGSYSNVMGLPRGVVADWLFAHATYSRG